MSAITASPKVATPFKPRLLWRGSLLLPDGTAIPGIAFVSNAPPSFTSHSDAIHGTSAEQFGAIKQAIPPLTLSREQQDALSLSIEMVRHAPINISEVIEDVEKDLNGNLLKPKRFVSSSSAKENGENMHVSYQAAGGVRMYVDPAYPSSVAYMERVFCYENDSDEEEMQDQVASNHTPSDRSHTVSKPPFQQEEIKSSQQQSSASSVIVLSLDRSHRYSLVYQDRGDDDDVFSHGTTSNKYTLPASSDDGIEAVIIGVKGMDENGKSHLELHVGQKVIRRIARADAKENEKRSSMNVLGPRPDDPAPRGLSRMLSAKCSSAHTKLSRQSSLPSASISSSSTSPQFLSPALPAAENSIKKQPSLSNISTNDERSSSMPILKRGTSASSHQQAAAATQNKRSKSMMATITQAKESEELQKIEEKNRSLIKKLVHHQLLGKGLEKTDEEYLKCFNPTCNGTVLALRRQFKIEVIDRAQAASIIEKHLEMYL